MVHVKFLIALTVIFTSCNKYPPERNYILFEDPVEQVQDSIQAIIPLAYKIFGGKAGSFVDYENQDILSINTQEVGKLDLLEKPEQLARLLLLRNHVSQEEVERFLVLYKYLKSNHLQDLMTLSDTGLIKLNYRDKNYNHFNLIRNVILVNTPEDTLHPHFRNQKMILDRKGKLLLTAPQGAKIY